MKTSRLKILHVVISLNPGGMENGVANVARGLSPEEFEIHVCCLERSGSFAQRLPQLENVHVLHKPPGFSPGTIWRLNRLIARLRPDIIHTHNLGPLIYGGLATGFGFLRPLLHGEHHLLQADELTHRRLRQRTVFYRACKKIHTVSGGVREQLLGLGFPAEKIVTLLNGVDYERFQTGDSRAARRQIGVPEAGIFLGIVGRFIPTKQHRILLEAFTCLARTRSDIHLMLIGGGGSEEKSILRMANASEFAARIHCTGFQNELPPYYQALDLLVVPSFHEGLSNAVLEAMACGVPVLAHPACGTTEVISSGQDGIIADLQTADKLERQLEQLLARPENLPKLGAAARENILRRFSIEIMTERYRQLYQTLAGGDAIK